MTDQQHRFALEFLTQLPLADFNDVLDIGSGPGYQSEWFAQQGKHVTAFDLVAPSVDVPFLQGDAEDLPFASETFDAVWTHHTFEHLQNPLKCLAEAHRVLLPNGWLFFTVPQIDGVISNGHIVSYDMALVIYHLAMCGFDVRHGFFGKFRSHLRCAVRRVHHRDMESNITRLRDQGRLPASCDRVISNTGRFTRQSLVTKWLDGTTHTYQ